MGTKFILKSYFSYSLMFVVASAGRPLISILFWSESDQEIFLNVVGGKLTEDCLHDNCYILPLRESHGNYTSYDIIAFYGPEVLSMSRSHLPKERLPHQKYVFASGESADNYPMCRRRFNNYFHLTLTYKLNSDQYLGYIVIKDMEDNIVGPLIDMNWIQYKNMVEYRDEGFMKTLRTKKNAAAWFVSNCDTRNKRMEFVNKLRKRLMLYNLTVDIYGSCGTHECAKEKMADCLKYVENKYYFYFAFENSDSEDYVTEKLLHALQHNIVPVVYGGANYTRFMPRESYIHAKRIGVQKLAATMNAIIKDTKRYKDFFRWKNYYSYHSPPDGICSLCSLANDERLMKRNTVLGNFRDWWTPPGRCD